MCPDTPGSGQQRSTEDLITAQRQRLAALQQLRQRLLVACQQHGLMPEVWDQKLCDALMGPCQGLKCHGLQINGSAAAGRLCKSALESCDAW